MKILIRTIIVIAMVVVVILVIAVFTNKEYSIERSITIKQPKEEVFNYIKYLKNQNNFNKWWLMDPASKKEYKGTDGTEGFIATWDSEMKEVGKGEEEIKKITYGERIDFEIRFLKPFEGTSETFIITESVENNQTKVKWVFNGEMKYPMNAMLLFMNMDNVLGKDLEASLAKLKSILEK